MAGMTVEVVGATWYSVELEEDDVRNIKKWIDENINEDELSYSDMKDLMIRAMEELEIPFFDREYVKSDYNTEDIKWSTFEDRSPEEILASVG